MSPPPSACPSPASVPGGTPRATGLSKRLAILFACYALVATMLIANVMPPLQAADEMSHAARADALGHGVLIDRRSRNGKSAGAPASKGLSELDAAFLALKFHPECKVNNTMRKAAAVTPPGALTWTEFPNTAIYPPFFYVPAAAGFRIARALDLTEWHSILLARMLTALASVAVATAAVALAGGFAPFLFTLLCLPMTLGLFAAVSQDGLMIASAALGVVLLIRGRRRSFVSACLLLAAVAIARPPYLPLCLLPLLAPTQRRIERAAGAGFAAAAVFGWTTLTARLTLPPETPAHIAAQFAAIGQHPSLLLRVPANTLRLEWLNGLPVGREFIGVLGWLDTTLPNPFYALAGLVLLLSASLSSGYGPGRTKLAPIVASLAIAGAIGMVYVIQYLDWTAVAGLQVEGVQGRYMLALAPALLFVLPERGLPPRALLLAVASFPVLSIVLVMRAIVVRYGVA